MEIQEFVGADPVLLVRPFVHNDHYWQVYFDTNRMLRESFAQGELPLPRQPLELEDFPHVYES